MKMIKKGLMIIGLLCVLLFAVSACGGLFGAEDDSDAGDNNSPSVATESATTESDTSDASTTDSAETDVSEETESKLWDTYYYVDDFNQETDEWFVGNSTQLIGTFSNSATTNSALLVDMAVDCYGEIGIFLWEYGNNLVKNSSNNYDEAYSITMQGDDGVNYDMTGTMYCGGDRILIDENYRPTVLSLLQGTSNVKVRITNMDRTVESYLFVMIPSNFSEVYAANTGA